MEARPLRIAALFLLLSALTVPRPIRAQSDSASAADSTAGNDAAAGHDAAAGASFEDPARNRLLWMSTGRVMQGGRFSFGAFELVVLQGGYGIADIAQLNATATLGYRSVGTKFQIVPPMGWFQGLAFSADAGFAPESDRFLIPRGGLYALTLSASAGTDDLSAHFSAMEVYPTRTGSRSVTYLQAGLAIGLQRSAESATSLLAELWMVEHNYPSHHFSAALMPAGFRYAKRGYTVEFAVMVRPPVDGSDSGAFPIIPVPYIAVQWFI